MDRHRLNIHACRVAIGILKARREEMEFLPNTTTQVQRNDLERAIELFEAFVDLLTVSHLVSTRPEGINRKKEPE